MYKIYCIFFLLPGSLFLLILNMLIMGSYFYIEWSLVPLFSIFWTLSINIDFISLSFSLTVILISFMIFIYSISYMKKMKNKMQFFILLMLFIMSMNLLIFSHNISTLLLGWDGLGISSFLLVKFYDSMKSMNSSLITIMINRMGDILIIFSIGLSMMMCSFNFIYWTLGGMMIFFIMAAGLSKSAQVPFSFWLPKAMAAPTPVSSLVHSSTLVTAGVYVTLRIPHMLLNEWNMILLVSSSSTLFISGVMAYTSFDLKEIIAFSTMSHISLMMMSMTMNLISSTFFHLCSHALFKALLFMCAGYMIYFSYGEQDIRKMSIVEFDFFLKIAFFSASFSMVGIPFLAGFYSKEMIIDLSLMSLIYLLSVLFTSIYSMRLLTFIYSSLFKSNQSKKNFMETSSFLLSWMPMLFGSFFQWMSFSLNFIYPSFFFKMYIWLLIMFSSFSPIKSFTNFYKKMYFCFSQNVFKKMYSIYSSCNKYIYLLKNTVYYIEKGWLGSFLELKMNLIFYKTSMYFTLFALFLCLN